MGSNCYPYCTCRLQAIWWKGSWRNLRSCTSATSTCKWCCRAGCYQGMFKWNCDVDVTKNELGWQVLLLNMRFIKDQNLIKTFCRKMAPPLGMFGDDALDLKSWHLHLVTLLSSPPEVQYIALRNISLILQRRPEVLSNEMRVFFCRYNDPPYVKLEKLEILIRLCNDRNVDQLLSELKE